MDLKLHVWRQPGPDARGRMVTYDATGISTHASFLEMLDIVNEPTAAALAFGEHLGYLTDAGAPRDDLTLLVYDLGGGTFDVTVIRLLVGEVQTLATDGDFRLGGRDWDERLFEYVAQKFEDQHRIDPRDDERARAVADPCHGGPVLRAYAAVYDLHLRVGGVEVDAAVDVLDGERDVGEADVHHDA